MIGIKELQRGSQCYSGLGFTRTAKTCVRKARIAFNTAAANQLLGAISLPSGGPESPSEPCRRVLGTVL